MNEDNEFVHVVDRVYEHAEELLRRLDIRQRNDVVNLLAEIRSAEPMNVYECLDQAIETLNEGTGGV